MQTRQVSHTESKTHILNSKKMYTDRLLPSPQHSKATLLFCEPDASPSWTAESMIISVQHKDGIDQQRGWISQLSPTPEHEADHSWGLKLYSSPTGGKSLAELYLRVLVSCICLQWALNVAQNEAAQPRQSQGGIQGEPLTFLKKYMFCTSLLAMRLWKGSPQAQSLLKMSLEQPSAAPSVSSFCRDTWYSCCPCWRILLVLLAKLPQSILVYSVRIYEWASKQKTCCWISMLSHTLITNHLGG